MIKKKEGYFQGTHVWNEKGRLRDGRIFYFPNFFLSFSTTTAGTRLETSPP